MIVTSSFRQGVECDRILSYKNKRKEETKHKKRDSHYESMKVIQVGIATTILNGKMKTPSSNEGSQCQTQNAKDFAESV
jgi:hypothetical protein